MEKEKSKTRLVYNVSDEMWREVKALAILHNITMGAMLEKMIAFYLKTNKTK